MNISICENGCGRTSLDPDSHIERISIKVRQNGGEEGTFEGGIEACKACRETLHNTLRSMFTPKSIRIKVTVSKGGK